MSRRRIRFSKTGMGKYISHLDLLRCFTRAIMRSELPVVYSQGFNPHQKITFALPLPIGVTSECECADIEFEDTVSDLEIKVALNQNLPMDIHVLEVGDVVCKASDIVSAEYHLVIVSDKPIPETLLREFFGAGEIHVVKKTKRGEKCVNLLDFIKAWETIPSEQDSICMRIVLSAGGVQNIKPEILIHALSEYLQNTGISVKASEVHRVKIFCRQGEGLTMFV